MLLSFHEELPYSFRRELSVDIYNEFDHKGKELHGWPVRGTRRTFTKPGIMAAPSDEFEIFELDLGANDYTHFTPSWLLTIHQVLRTPSLKPLLEQSVLRTLSAVQTPTFDLSLTMELQIL